VQRSEEVAARELFVGSMGGCHRLPGDDRDDGVDGGVDTLNLLKMRRDHLARRKLLRANLASQVDRIERADFWNHMSTKAGLNKARPTYNDCKADSMTTATTRFSLAAALCIATIAAGWAVLIRPRRAREDSRRLERSQSSASRTSGRRPS
jgi:hypothetical protein